MQEDNLYRRTFPQTIVPEQAEAADKERRDVLSELPILQAVIDRLQAAVDHLGSINAIGSDVLTSPDDFMHVVAANKLAKASLEAEIVGLTALIEDHAKQR